MYNPSSMPVINHDGEAPAQSWYTNLGLGSGATLTRFRTDGSYSRLMVWVALVTQLHLLAVQDLHNHNLKAAAPNASQGFAVTVDGRPQIQIAQTERGPLCEACQITRHGSVQFEASSPVPFEMVELGEVAPLSLPAFPLVFRCSRTGRAPPFFS